MREEQTGRLWIGRVAERAGVNIETLLFYQRRGLLDGAGGTGSGRHGYDEETVRVARFIRRAQDLGFSLAEVTELLRLRHEPASACREVQAIAETKLHSVRGKIQQLRGLETVLTGLLAECRSQRLNGCLILEALGEDR